MSDIAQELRQRMADAVNFHIKKEGLTGVKAAKMVGMSQSRMSKIVSGNLKGVAAESMAKVLGAFGYRLESYIGANEGSEFIFSLSESTDPVEDGPSSPDVVKVDLTDVPAEGEDDFDPDFDRVVSDEE